MTDRNAIIEDYDEEDLDEMDIIISGDHDEESDNVNIPKNQKRQTLIQFGDKCRVRLVENDCNIFLEKKTNSKTTENIDEVDTVETKENYVNDGYMCSIESVVKHLMNRHVKEKILNKQEIKDLLEVRDVIKESNNEIKIMAKEIVDAIRNNECLVDISKEALERSDRNSK